MNRLPSCHLLLDSRQVSAITFGLTFRFRRGTCHWSQGRDPPGSSRRLEGPAFVVPCSMRPYRHHGTRPASPEPPQSSHVTRVDDPPPVLPLLSQCAFTVNERRPALCPGFDLSDDSWRPRPLCRRPFRHLSPQASLALPVKCHPSSHLFSSIKLSVCLLDLALVQDAHAYSSDGYPLSR